MAITNFNSLKKMLPKKYEHRKRVLLEIRTALYQHKFLEPILDKHVFNDGTAKILICLVGTIMVVYEGITYNIPVCLWLEESYPRTAPICYVKPTRDMMIIASKHVNSNGQIQLPYLDEWKHAQCDLHTLIQVIIAVFGEMPPLRMRPAPCSEQSLESSGTADTSQFTLRRDDGLPFQMDNETNC